MAVLPDRVDERSETYQANRAAMLELLRAHDEQLALANAGGGPKYVERHRQRGKLLVRERIQLLLDPDSPFLELSPLAAWGTDFPVGAGLVTGIGVIEGVECVLSGNDATVRGGTSGPAGVKKSLRALEIARENRLPYISLTESGGADLPHQSEIFLPGGRSCRDITSLSAAGIPTLSIVFGSSTAGGAYQPGMSDYVVMIDQRSKVFLGGPPLVKMATGEESDDESLGGAEMHARVSGLADYFATDEVDALRLGRQIVRHLNHRKLGPAPRGAGRPPRHDPDQLLAVASWRTAATARWRAELAVVQAANDPPPDAQGIDLVDGVVVGEAADPGVHVGAAEALVVALLAGRHLHQRRPAEEHLRALVDHDDVVAHAGHVGAAGGRVAEDERDRRHAGRGQAGEVAEALPAGDEDLGLVGEVGAARLDEVDQREAVLPGDLHRPQRLRHGRRRARAAADGRVVGDDHALGVLDDTDAGEHAGADGEVGAPRRER